MFLQIHTLTAYPASLLNRDDAGLAKRIPFGNATRLRVSSQCLKRHWRDTLVATDNERSLSSELPDGFRSRRIFERVSENLRERGVDEQAARVLALCVKNLALKSSKDSDESKSEHKSEDLRIKQPIYVSKPEIDYLTDLALKINALNHDLEKSLALTEAPKKKDKLANEKKEFRDALGLTDDNLRAMRKSAMGITAALFGRMVTSDLLARVDAPVHVAHAFTVHAANTEMDYFTVVDDLNRDDETGAAHANQAELGAGVYYGYVAVDVPLLVSNLTGCEPRDWRQQDSTTPKRVLAALVDSIVRQSPGAKKGSTAPYAWADLLLLEAGTAQPRSLANAFLEAVPAKGDVRQQAAERMLSYLDKLDAMHGIQSQRQLSTTLPLSTAVTQQPVEAAVGAILDALWA
ncbi:type I-E CRISPR-associated protein Cas7/Cse4/CasC [Caldimonas thermodepolymerans]|jgi:CRISPR system Cascade subunit CasC|uniref:CRISPR-associated Cse4 family protein n=1 Tax=Caldimonas thermodepolymerans TaxID=215580 RepID=A0AA46HVT1_9BURK|nr:type I-E CRISPR-associated protein Cas7/Cse4/CasC [Caldimonas thermodepolymerans]TCP07487.1 CRISPR-associated Cse4 family protein [Caldimonas thermodepolymerans]UZG43994.1 type I-E CRISPR-associated protein Cas7/Cse4/CasC [Caldimonas thermodepolymerans]UZG47661.1 type I-E CRISPR-associated protein Cas7/Cse4/CasC [Caldimonas thermodepolymerans]